LPVADLAPPSTMDPLSPYEPSPYEPSPYEPAPYEPSPYEPATYVAAPYVAAPYRPDSYQRDTHDRDPLEPAPYEPGPYEPGPYEPEPYEPAPGWTTESGGFPFHTTLDSAPDGAPVSASPVSAGPVSASPVSAAHAAASPSGQAQRTGDETDPEQMLASYEWRFDPDTLQEVVEGDEVDDLLHIRDLLTAKLEGKADNPTRARLLSLRAIVSRILGDTHQALADGKLALAHAEATGELRRISIAQARLAHVLQWSGEYSEADRLFALANSPELPDRLRATMHQHAGKCAYDQGRFIEACNHFELALELRKEEDPELIAQTALALDAVFRRVAERGWGPYPRTPEEILKIRKPPDAYLDEGTRLWGYLDEDAEFVIAPAYADAQPFRDGVAWVQHPNTTGWELIDEGGRVLIPHTAGYLGVSDFSDGIAWVSRDGNTRWFAIDKTNTVLISTGFEDVRPFRRGVAAVRRGPRWGAVDGVGRVVVPFLYDGFATALHDGRYIDGFSDEGLAVVSQAGRKGVVDRAGRVLVPPTYPVVVIHPVAFLFVDPAQRWGALDRKGRHLIAPKFGSRVHVTDEIDRLLADTRPML
jgi:tetratricopeptide (TPR) repeat protein